MGHAAQTEFAHAMMDDRTARVAGDDQPRVVEPEIAVPRADAQHPGLGQRLGREKLKLGVSAAPFAMTVGTVGV